jgi:hypothetical protein
VLWAVAPGEAEVWALHIAACIRLWALARSATATHVRRNVYPKPQRSDVRSNPRTSTSCHPRVSNSQASGAYERTACHALMTRANHIYGFTR